MLKRVIIGEIVLLLVSCLIMMTGCTKTGAASGTNKATEPGEQDSLNLVLGGEKNPYLQLNEKDIQAADIDYSRIIPVDKIFNRDNGYKDIYDTMVSDISDLCKNIKEFSLYGESGFYVSTVPIRYFDAYDINMQENMISELCIFSKDFSKGAMYTLFYVDGEITVTCNFTLNSNVKSVLKDKPDEEFIFLSNGGEVLIIDSDNEIIAGGNNMYEITGDYYHALEYELLAVSYNEITDEENLVWIDVQ